MNKKIFQLLLRIEQRVLKLFEAPKSSHRAIIYEMTIELQEAFRKENLAEGDQEVGQFLKLLEAEKEALEVDPISEELKNKIKEPLRQMRKLVGGESPFAQVEPEPSPPTAKEKEPAPEAKEEPPAEEEVPAPEAKEEPPAEEDLTDFKQQYLATLGDKLSELEKFIANFLANINEQTQQELKQAVHKIAGSAGSYDFMKAAELCRALEAELTNQADASQVDQWKSKLEDFFTSLKKEFANSAPQGEAKPPSPMEELKSVPTPTLEDRIQTAKTKTEEFCKSGEEKEQLALKNSIHDLAQSAAHYGYEQVAKMCSSLEGELLKPIELEQLREWEEKLEKFFLEIQDALTADMQVLPESEDKKPSPDEEGIVKVGQGFDEMLVDLAHTYRDSCQTKLGELESAVQAVLNKPNESNISYLRGFLQNFVASAASYGYDNLSQYCKRAVDFIDVKMHDVLDVGLDANTIERVQELVPKIREYFEEEPSFTPAEKQETQELSGEIDLFLAHDNFEVLDFVTREGRVRGLKVMVQSDPTEAEKLLKSDTFRAKFIVINARFLNGANWVEAYRKKKGVKTRFGLVFDSLTLQDRREATEKNIDYLFEMPLSAEQILQVTRSITEVEIGKSFKILVMDTDFDTCQMLQAYLEEVRMEVKAIQDPKTFFTTLGQFQPDLLLVDLSLLGFEGMDILKSLRVDVKYRHLPVMVITDAQDEEGISKAFSMKVEDFIIKPLNKKLLQARVSSFAKTLSMVKLSQDRDLLTGLYTSRSFSYLLEGYLERMTERGVRHAIVLFGIDHYQELYKAQSPHFAEQIILTTTNNLRKTLWSYTLVGRITESTFALFLEGVDVPQAKEVMKNFLETLLQDPFFVKHEGMKISFSAGLAAYPLDGNTSDSLILAAQKTLREAQVFEGIKILTYSGEKAVLAKKKEICVIDDDEDIHNLLRFAFEKKGFAFSAILSCEETRQFFASRKGNLPDLIILDRNMPDGDGIELFRELKKEYPATPPIIVLSASSSEEDILFGLEEGAVDYITKPFTMSILMQKVMKVFKEQ